MRTGPSFAALLLLTTFFAGCLAGVKDTLPGEEEQPLGSVLKPFVNPIVLDHEHKDLQEHQLTNNVELVGREPKVLPGGVAEIDTAGDTAYVALLGYGFAIVDLKEPTAPKVLSRTKVDVPQTPQFGAYTADLKVDRTGDWVFLAMELSTTPGVLIYDARDKAAPKLAGFWASPGKLLGCHMIEYAVIGDQEYLFCAPLDAGIYVGLILPATPAPAREIKTIARWTPTTPSWYQKEVSQPALMAQKLALSGHDDMTYMLDPLTLKPTIYVSFWEMGVWFVDVSVPAAPMTLGYWDGQESKLFNGNIHTTMAFKHEGRRIIASIPEVASPPTLFILDATNLEKPKLLAEWTALPSFKDANGKDHSGTFSMHNFQVVEGTIYLAMGHAGIWVIDVSTTERLSAPEPVGSFAPHEPREDGADYAVGAWDVVVWKGYMLTGDSNGGFYVLHHVADPAGEPSYSSFA